MSIEVVVRLYSQCTTVRAIIENPSALDGEIPVRIKEGVTIIGHTFQYGEKGWRILFATKDIDNVYAAIPVT